MDVDSGMHDNQATFFHSFCGNGTFRHDVAQTPIFIALKSPFLFFPLENYPVF